MCIYIYIYTHIGMLVRARRRNMLGPREAEIKGSSMSCISCMSRKLHS